MYILTQKLRLELKKPFGELYRNSASVFKNLGEFITVGDICSFETLKYRKYPKLMIYDNRIKRRETSEEVRKAISSYQVNKIVVRNDSGTISDESMDAIENSLKSKAKEKIEVIGEEDLLVMPCVLFASDGTKVLYGQPDEGIVVIDVNKKTKEAIKNLFSKMVVRWR